MEGWKAAAESFREQAEKERAARLTGLPQELPSYASLGLGSSWHISHHGTNPRIRTANDLVLAHVRDYPGQRGVDIAAAFARQIPERTVRTALHRLKNGEKIKIVDGRWYVCETAPATPRNCSLMEVRHEPA